MGVRLLPDQGPSAPSHRLTQKLVPVEGLAVDCYEQSARDDLARIGGEGRNLGRRDGLAGCVAQFTKQIVEEHGAETAILRKNL